MRNLSAGAVALGAAVLVAACGGNDGGPDVGDPSDLLNDRVYATSIGVTHQPSPLPTGCAVDFWGGAQHFFAFSADGGVEVQTTVDDRARSRFGSWTVSSQREGVLRFDVGSEPAEFAVAVTPDGGSFSGTGQTIPELSNCGFTYSITTP